MATMIVTPGVLVPESIGFVQACVGLDAEPGLSEYNYHTPNSQCNGWCTAQCKMLLFCIYCMSMLSLHNIESTDSMIIYVTQGVLVMH